MVDVICAQYNLCVGNARKEAVEKLGRTTAQGEDYTQMLLYVWQEGAVSCLLTLEIWKRTCFEADV